MLIASARAGNVIGGGDWAEDRIVPDCIRSLQNNCPIAVRNPAATRPWQHVLEPLSGYLWLAAILSKDPSIPRAFNFGPDPESTRCVRDLVTEILTHWQGQWEDKSDPRAVHEAKLLNLSIARAASVLNWKPVWNFEKTIEHTISWYQNFTLNKVENAALVSSQIKSYCQDAAAVHSAWAL